jgi:copper homeostasis protein
VTNASESGKPAKIPLEVCISSVESAIASERGGAQRVELCSDLVEGGVTPSAGMIRVTRESISIGLQVMIRPRGGDFLYSAEEFAVMKRDIVAAKELGANGVVIGLLDEDANVDLARTRELVELARPMNVTFHRAFDMSQDFFRSLEDIISCGVTRILTSGGKPRAEESVDTLAKLVAAARGRITIMACGEIEKHNVKRIIEKSRVPEVHAGLEAPVASTVRHRNEGIAMGSVQGREYERSLVSAETVRDLISAM